VLSISGMPIGWALIVLVVYGLIRGRREAVRLVLGLALIVRARKRDLPAVARAVFGGNDGDQRRPDR
jgi:hypothetical protein